MLNWTRTSEFPERHEATDLANNLHYEVALDREIFCLEIYRNNKIVRDFCEWNSAEDAQEFAEKHLTEYVAGKTDIYGRTKLHPDDIATNTFADRMKEKLKYARESTGRGGWDNPKQCSNEYLSDLLVKLVAKGDPVDVANVAMMISMRGETIAQKKGD